MTLTSMTWGSVTGLSAFQICRRYAQSQNRSIGPKARSWTSESSVASRDRAPSLPDLTRDRCRARPSHHRPWTLRSWQPGRRSSSEQRRRPPSTWWQMTFYVHFKWAHPLQRPGLSTWPSSSASNCWVLRHSADQLAREISARFGQMEGIQPEAVLAFVFDELGVWRCRPALPRCDHAHNIRGRRH